MNVDYVVYLLVEVVCLVFSIMVHEIAHGWMAHRLGDPTAKNAGRLTLNPLKHLDPVGSVVLPLCMLALNGPVFAYAKPVPYNPRYFKNRRLGELLVAFAGPVSNLLQALVGALVAWAAYTAWPDAAVAGGVEQQAVYWTYRFGATYCYINLVLAFFNLIPLPPLDGASIVMPFLNEKGARVFHQVKSYSMYILLALFVLVPVVLGWSPVSWYLQHTAGAIYGLLMP